MRSIAILVLLSSFVEAKVVSVPLGERVHDLDLEEVQTAMVAAGHAVDTASGIACGGRPIVCRVNLPDASPATAADLAPFFDNAKTRAQKRADDKVREDELLAKMDAGTATQAEQAELFRLLKKKAP